MDVTHEDSKVVNKLVIEHREIQIDSSVISKEDIAQILATEVSEDTDKIMAESLNKVIENDQIHSDGNIDNTVNAHVLLQEDQKDFVIPGSPSYAEQGLKKQQGSSDETGRNLEKVWISTVIVESEQEGTIVTDYIVDKQISSQLLEQNVPSDNMADNLPTADKRNDNLPSTGKMANNLQNLAEEANGFSNSDNKTNNFQGFKEVPNDSSNSDKMADSFLSTPPELPNTVTLEHIKPNENSDSQTVAVLIQNDPVKIEVENSQESLLRKTGEDLTEKSEGDLVGRPIFEFLGDQYVVDEKTDRIVSIKGTPNPPEVQCPANEEKDGIIAKETAVLTEKQHENNKDTSCAIDVSTSEAEDVGQDANTSNTGQLSEDMDEDHPIFKLLGDKYSIEELEEHVDVLVSPDVRRGDGSSFLHWAALRNEFQVCKLLLQNGADPNIFDEKNRTSLHWWVFSAGEKDLNVSELLLDNEVNPNMQDTQGQTPGHMAVVLGKTFILKMLLKCGWDMNIKTIKGNTPLHMAIKLEHINVAKFLVKNGADVNIEDAAGQICLHLVVQSEYADEEIYKKILEAGSEINHQDHIGQTPLHLAINKGEDTVADFLIQIGAKVGLEDKYGKSPLKIAILLKETQLFSNMWKISSLVQKAPSLLHLACQWNRCEIARILLWDGQIPVDSKDMDGNTCLHIAGDKFSQKIDTAELLFTKGANLDALNDLGETPLHCALRKKKPKLASFLITKMADVNICDKKGIAALTLMDKQQQKIHKKTHKAQKGQSFGFKRFLPSFRKEQEEPVQLTRVTLLQPL